MKVALLIIIWLVCDFILGRRMHLRHSAKRETPILHGNLDIFPHGKELFADYFTELRKASKHIHVLFYIVKKDRFSQAFLQILKEKAQAGVEVRLLADRLGSYKISRKMAAELRAAGVHFAFSNRIKLPFLFYSSQVRNHRKITVIDGKIGYLGGFNIGKEYIDEKPKLSPWRDYHLKVTGESVAFLQSEFFMDWQEYGGEDLSGETHYFPVLEKGPVRHRFTPTEAWGLEDNFLDLIERAASSITIGTPYFIPGKRLVNALLRRAREGIAITIIVPFTSDHPLVQEASYRDFRKLLREPSVRVFQYKNGFYHAKTILIDDKICDIGSANFDKRSLFLNKEINCYIYDPAFIGRVQEVIRRDLADSVPLTLADLNRPNLWRSVKELAAGAISYFL